MWLKLLKAIVYSNIYIAVMACLLLYRATVLFKLGQYPLSIYLFAFSAVLFSYNVARLLPQLNKNLDEPINEMGSFVRKNIHALLFISTIAFLLMLITLFVLYKFILWSLIICSILSLFYLLPYYRKKKQYNLRAIGWLKPFVIGLIWSIFTVILPIEFAEQAYEPAIAYLFAFNFLFISAITLPFEIRDLSLDSETGLKTIPMLIGNVNTRWFAIGLLGLASGLVVLYSKSTTLLLWEIGVVMLSILMIFNASSKRKELYYTFWIDGLIGLLAFSSVIGVIMFDCCSS